MQEKEALLASPNNILGVEYLKALYKRNSSIKPYTTKRQGSGYHNVDFRSQFPSATAIRRLMTKHPSECSADTHLTAEHLPAKALDILRKEYGNSLASHSFITENTFSAQLHYKLLSEAAHGFTRYLDVSEDISDRICKHLYDFENFVQFTDLLKTKDTTRTRLSRCLLHILLGITNEHMEYRATNQVPYARILGFHKDSAPLLNAIKKNSTIPFITKLADGEQTLTAYYENTGVFNELETKYLACRMLAEDVAINRIYESAVSLQMGCPMRNEYRTPLVIL